MRSDYDDGIRTGYAYPENLPHHGLTGRYAAKVWASGKPEPGPNENHRGGFTTRQDALNWIKSWMPAG